MHKLTIPNLVTLVRPLLTLPFVWSVSYQQRAIDKGCESLFILFGLICASDILDGRLARRFGQTSSFGRQLDHFCDITFILSSLLIYVVTERAPWWLPVSIAWAFMMYLVDSWQRTSRQMVRTLIPTRLGHWGGILYYLTVGLITLDTCHLSIITRSLIHYGWFLAMTLLALVSGLERLLILLLTPNRASD